MATLQRFLRPEPLVSCTLVEKRGRSFIKFWYLFVRKTITSISMNPMGDMLNPNEGGLSQLLNTAEGKQIKRRVVRDGDGIGHSYYELRKSKKNVDVPRKKVVGKGSFQSKSIDNETTTNNNVNAPPPNTSFIVESSASFPGAKKPKGKKIRTTPIAAHTSGYRSFLSLSPDRKLGKKFKSLGNWVEPLATTTPSSTAIDFRSISRVHNLRANIIAGNYVSMTDITAIKSNVRQKQAQREILKHSILGNAVSVSANGGRSGNIQRVKIFCVKGIVKIPTPNTPLLPFNTFGTPAELRISLTSSTKPEYSGKRRFFFDFKGFQDTDIRLYLEGDTRLVITGQRPDRVGESAMRLTDFIDLPEDLPVDNLRIVRDLFGTLIVEEAWNFN